MSMANIARQRLSRSLFSQNRSLVTSSEHLLTSAAKSTTGVTVCNHAPGSCVLCNKSAAPIGKTFFGRYFSTDDSSSPSKDQQSETTSKPSGRKETTSVGTEGGMLGERSGPSKEATPSDKEEMEDEVEEQHVAQKKEPETAPWAS